MNMPDFSLKIISTKKFPCEKISNNTEVRFDWSFEQKRGGEKKKKKLSSTNYNLSLCNLHLCSCIEHDTATYLLRSFICSTNKAIAWMRRSPSFRF